METATLVREAAKRFVEGDNAGFVACFDGHVVVYTEPELSNQPLAVGRDQLAAWSARAHGHMAHLALELVSVTEHPNGAVTEATLVGDESFPEAWRIALAIRVEGDVITEVRAFRDREDAMARLLEMQ